MNRYEERQLAALERATLKATIETRAAERAAAAASVKLADAQRAALASDKRPWWAPYVVGAVVAASLATVFAGALADFYQIAVVEKDKLTRENTVLTATNAELKKSADLLPNREATIRDQSDRLAEAATQASLVAQRDILYRVQCRSFLLSFSRSGSVCVTFARSTSIAERHVRSTPHSMVEYRAS